MNLKITLATSLRVMRQLSHDKRTLLLLFVVPGALLGLLAWIYSDTPRIFDFIGAPFLAMFPFVVMFLITSITTLRERSSGTLERLMAMPTRKLDILFGYTITFGILAILQGILTSVLAVHFYGLDVAGPEWMLIVVALIDALLGTTLGLFISAFAQTEFQAIQFMPAFIFPQFLVSGILVPIDKLPDTLYYLAKCFPLTYAVDAMQRVTVQTTVTKEIYTDLGIVILYGLVAILLAGATLRRQTK
jgi:ABC-2 type transport system permease protein